MTHRVAFDLLDLDHPGTEVSEDRGAERCRVEGPELDDGHPGQGWGLRAVSCRPSRRLRSGRRPFRILLGPDGTAMLIDRRCGSTELGRSAGHLNQWTGLQHGPDQRVVDHHRRAVVHDLWVVEELRAVAEDLGPDIGLLLERLGPLLVGLLAHRVDRGFPEGDPHLRVLVSRAVLQYVVVLRPLEARGTQVRLPQPVCRLGELQPAAVGRQADHEAKEQRRVRHQRAGVGRRRGSESIRVARDDRPDQPIPAVVGEDALDERRLHPVAQATRLPLDEGRQDSVHGQLRCAERAVRGGDEGRSLSRREARERVEAADLGHHHGLVPPHARPAVVAAETGHRGVDQPRVDLG